MVLAILILVAWEGTVEFFDVPTYFVPGPVQIAEATYKNWLGLLQNSLWTFWAASLGLASALVVSFLIAIIFVYSKTAEEGIRPFLIALQGTPILALAPIFNAWFGSGTGSKVACVFVVCFFPLVVGFGAGFSSPKKDELELYKSLGASRFEVFWQLRWPKALAWVFSALKVSVPLSVVGAIVAEFVGSSKGLGYLILTSSYYLRVDLMFAGVLACASISTIGYGIVLLAESKFYFWKGYSS